MPLSSRTRMLRELCRFLDGKHLPGCYTRSLPLSDCSCGGPERFILLEAIADNQLKAMALAPHEVSVLCE
jgi:hypothetical protein